MGMIVGVAGYEVSQSDQAGQRELNTRRRLEQRARTARRAALEWFPCPSVRVSLLTQAVARMSCTFRRRWLPGGPLAVSFCPKADLHAGGFEGAGHEDPRKKKKKKKKSTRVDTTA